MHRRRANCKPFYVSVKAATGARTSKQSCKRIRSSSILQRLSVGHRTAFFHIFLLLIRDIFDKIN
jgi:hypothetical protein